MTARLTYLDLKLIRSQGLNSFVVRDWMGVIAQDIYAEIYVTAPRTVRHGYSYRDHFRLWTTRTSLDEGYKTYVIAERFQWRWIEFGWTEWRDEIKHAGQYTMTKALMKQRIT